MSEHTPTIPPKIYEHASRKDWGRAVLLQEQVDRHTFLFEDGAERTLHIDYIEKMQILPLEAEDAHRIGKLARRNQAPSPSTSRKSKLPPKKPDITFTEQVSYFMKLYPAGFEDDKYIRSERGEGNASKAGAKLKDAVVERAEEQLSRENLSALIDAEDFSAVHRLAYEFLSSIKGAVQKANLTRFSNMSSESHPRFAKALYEFLYGETQLNSRFDGFLTALEVDEGPSWPLATAIGAHVYPQDHLLVKPTAVKKQALILDIDPKYNTTPNPATYMQFLKAATKTRELLEEAGQRPKDLLDVATFISKTLSPKAIKEATA